MKKYLSPIGFIVIVIVMIYLEAPYSLINKDYVQVTSIPNEVIRADGETLVNESEMPNEKDAEETHTEEAEEVLADYTLEMILDGKTVDGDYVIEEFREYEVYRDGEGRIIKSIPTSNFDYLRYYQE